MRAALALALLLSAAAGCASADSGAAAGDESFPALTSVPRETDAITDPRYWERVEAEVLAAGQALRANPRAEPATPQQDPTLFLEEAREDLDEAREAHEPN